MRRRRERWFDTLEASEYNITLHDFHSECLHDIRYADESGSALGGFSFPESRSVAIAEYIGADGLEEMHVFAGLAWFDLGSWAWAHYIVEWGTRGIFQVISRDSRFMLPRGSSSSPCKRTGFLVLSLNLT